MTDRPLASAIQDPFRWQESVLSTRSLSYMSTVSAFGNQLPAQIAVSRTTSLAQLFPGRQRAMTEQSEDALEMARQGSSSQRHDILPESVAHSLLFALPQEIRDRIYTFCLASSVLPVIEWPGSQAGSLGLAPQLLRTCKAILVEAAPVLYSGNAFSFAHPSDANIFVRAISSPIWSCQISFINLHVRIQDLRLWMPYLTSSDEYRSVKHDFPSLKELVLRYKSNKWQHANPIDANMRTWCEDKGLDELIDGLRNAFSLTSSKDADDDHVDQDIYDEYAEDARPSIKSSTRQIAREIPHRTRTPVIKAICMCRVSLNQFLALTTDLQNTNNAATGSASVTASFISQAIQRVTGFNEDLGLAQEGEEFRGFTVADLKGRAKRVWETSAANTTPALVARTVFADRRHILLALEVFAYEHVHG